MKAKNGDKVKVEYTGTFDDGKVFDSSNHEGHSHPLEFTIGSGQVIKGFDDAVIGMELNQEKKIHLSSEEAYGEKDDKKVLKISREKLPKDQEPKVGMMLGMQTADGKQSAAKIIEVDDKDITVDLNHPLAGMDLNFELKVVEINPQ